jgi:hypothetical protein
MSSRLCQEIARLASVSRHSRIHDHSIIKELTMIVGYGRLAEMHPESVVYLSALRQHLQKFTEVACAHDHSDLCEHSQRIVELLQSDGDLADVA